MKQLRLSEFGVAPRMKCNDREFFIQADSITLHVKKLLISL